MPLLVLDAWEHAYYLQYQNRKREFFTACWNVFDWPDVARRFEAERKLRLDGAYERLTARAGRFGWRPNQTGTILRS